MKRGLVIVHVVLFWLHFMLVVSNALRLPGNQNIGLSQPQVLYSSAHTVSGSVVLAEDGDYIFVPHSHQHVEDAIARGDFIDAAHTESNFGQLRISTSGDYSDEVQVFSAGLLEGRLTALRIAQNFDNLHTYFTKTMKADLEEPMKWLHEQDDWVRGQCEDNGYHMSLKTNPMRPSLQHSHRHHHNHHHDRDDTYTSRFWDAICLAIRQFDGVIAGYTDAYHAGLVDKYLSYSDFLFMQSNGDLYDVIDSIDPTQGPSWNPGGDGASSDDDDNNNNNNNTSNNMKKRNGAFDKAQESDEIAAEKLFRSIALSGKCSALIKIAPDFSDIFMGHSTWDSFTAMLRIYKHYSFNLTQLQPAAQQISFSSYPGETLSDDDFYLLSSRMVVISTTNKIFNDELFEKLDTHSVLSWQRVRAAHWLATNGQEWASLLNTHNSGTYNNQFMVIDLDKFTPGHPPHPGLLTVAEQLPGMVVSKDMTELLTLSAFWPSFNVPYFPQIYNQSGYPDFIAHLEKYGQHFSKSTHWLSYTMSPRAKIFKRDHTGVVSLETMKKIMRSNNYKNDPYSEGHPICAICGRGDIDTSFPEARGCYDTKVTSYALALQMQAHAMNGPTTDGNLPIFQWAKMSRAVADGDALVHEGQPQKFNFKFEVMTADDVFSDDGRSNS